MKEEKTMHPYVPDWMPTGTNCYNIATNLTNVVRQ